MEYEIPAAQTSRISGLADVAAHPYHYHVAAGSANLRLWLAIGELIPETKDGEWKLSTKNGKLFVVKE